MPPNCCLCDKGLVTGDECELVCFRKTPDQEVWYTDAESRLLPDHPPNCEWFCEDHFEAAWSLVSLDQDQAVKMRDSGTPKVPWSTAF
jgi:hypothetical protein